MSKRFIGVGLVLALILSALLLSGCSTKDESKDTNTNTSNSSTEQPAQEDTTGLYTPKYVPNGKEVAVFDTDEGTFKVELNGTGAPIQVGNFIELVQDGYLNGTKFVRKEAIDANNESTTIVQFGSVESRDVSKEEIISAVKAGDTTYLSGKGSGRLLKDELGSDVITHFDGALCAANTGAPNSSGSMYYFSYGAQPNLDGHYTVFGKTTEGLDIVHKLQVGDTIKSVTIENANQ